MSFLDLLIHSFFLNPQVLVWGPEPWHHLPLPVYQISSRIKPGSSRHISQISELCKVICHLSTQPYLTHTTDLKQNAYPFYQPRQLSVPKFNYTSHFQHVDPTWPHITSPIPNFYVLKRLITDKRSPHVQKIWTIGKIKPVPSLQNCKSHRTDCPCEICTCTPGQ